MSKVVKVEKPSRSKGLTRIGVLVSVEQARWLTARSETTHIPMTALVRLAIDAYRASLERKAVKTAKSAPAAPTTDDAGQLDF